MEYFCLFNSDGEENSKADNFNDIYYSLKYEADLLFTRLVSFRGGGCCCCCFVFYQTIQARNLEVQWATTNCVGIIWKILNVTVGEISR